MDEFESDRGFLPAPWNEVRAMVRDWTREDSASAWRVILAVPCVLAVCAICGLAVQCYSVNWLLIVLVGGGLLSAAYMWNACMHALVLTRGRLVLVLAICLLFPVWGYLTAWLCAMVYGFAGVPQTIFFAIALVFILRSWLPAAALLIGEGVGLAVQYGCARWFSIPGVGFGLLVTLWHVFASTGIGLWSIRYRQLATAVKGRCRGCGYSLAGLRSTVCPECGDDVTELV